MDINVQLDQHQLHHYALDHALPQHDPQLLVRLEMWVLARVEDVVGDRRVSMIPA